jgi:hypothetical protein
MRPPIVNTPSASTELQLKIAENLGKALLSQTSTDATLPGNDVCLLNYLKAIPKIPMVAKTRLGKQVENISEPEV